MQADARPTRLLVTHGRATTAVKAWFERQNGAKPASQGHGALSISYLPWLTQLDYDRLLWACDLNFVRGEDSLVRALWAGAPFVWQIYPQHDGAHAAKLEAFLDWLQAPDSLRQFHRAWNGTGQRAPNWPMLPAPDLPAWQACALAARPGCWPRPTCWRQLLRLCGKKALKFEALRNLAGLAPTPAAARRVQPVDPYLFSGPLPLETL